VPWLCPALGLTVGMAVHRLVLKLMLDLFLEVLQHFTVGSRHEWHDRHQGKRRVEVCLDKANPLQLCSRVGRWDKVLAGWSGWLFVITHLGLVEK
jgi:hypothetical protein